MLNVSKGFCAANGQFRLGGELVRPIRVLHVAPTYLPATRYGGPIYSVHGLCRGLARLGSKVAVYTTNVDGAGVSDVPIGQPVMIEGVEVTYFSTGFGRRLYRSPGMASALTKVASDFDLVHLHSVFLWPTAAGSSSARSGGIPYVVAPRGMLVPELIASRSTLLKKCWIRLFERRNISNAASIHVTSEVERRDLHRLGLRPKRVDVIPNGFELPRDAVASGYSNNSTRRSRPTVLSLGRISWKKGLDRLILAMVHVPNARLVVAGNDDEQYMPQLRRLCAKHDLSSRTEFIGPVHGAKKWEAFANADVFALASHSENFGMAVLEAMACGIPVVVTPEVGLASVVQETGSGLVAEGTPDAFGRALARVISDSTLRKRMAEAGRATASRLFSWSVIAERTDALYRDLIHMNKKRDISNA